MSQTVRTTIVTGGSRGIDRAICKHFAAEGKNLVINYAGDLQVAEETTAECRELDAQVILVWADVSSAAGCEELFTEAQEAFKAVDVLVNNAGIIRDELILRMSEDNFDEVININLKGAFLCMKLASRIAMKQRWGRIINMSSVTGVRGNPGQINYSTSKAGLIGITKPLVKELAERSVTVNAVIPGMIETDMTGVLPDAAKKQLLQGIPMSRAGKPEEIAATVAFFTSEEAEYITGQVLCIDGGMAV